jgi:hypothetical protein
MGKAAPGAELWALISRLLAPQALAELGLLLACGLAAWGVARLLRGRSRREPGGSIWFGQRIVDGVLFPALALLGAVALRWSMRGVWPLSVIELAVPLLVSLLVIRITVRVLEVAFPNSRTVRLLERSLSWVVWGVLVLWLTGLLPIALDEMAAVHWKLGGADVTMRALVEGALSAAAVLVGALWLSAAIESR